MIDNKTRDLNRSFFDLMDKEKVGRFEIDRQMNLQVFTLTMQEIRTLLEKKIPFLDGSEGGIIKGKSQNFQGGIYAVIPYYIGSEFQNKFRFLGDVFPGYYITSPKSQELHSNRFIELENSIDNYLFSGSTPDQSEYSKEIVAEDNEHTFIFLSNLPQMIFTKHAFNANKTEILELDS